MQTWSRRPVWSHSSLAAQREHIGQARVRRSTDIDLR